MRTLLTLGAFVVAGLGAASAGALNLSGSDTLEDLTKEIIATCPGVNNITYVGGGSSRGETDLRDDNQQIAPMSRFLEPSRTCAAGNNGTGSIQTSEGYAHSLDGIAVLQSRREGKAGECDTNGDGVCAEACPAGLEPALYGCKDRQNAQQACIGVAYSPNPAAPARFFNVLESNGTAGLQPAGSLLATYDADAGLEYALFDWRDALRVIYAGVHNNTVPGGATIKDCNSDVRHTLANRWANFTTAACQTTRCQQIAHAWRRADLSGTTDTFLSLLGLPAITTAPFCNGTETQDLDPVRRTCRPEEQVCGRDGKLGLVLPVFVPEGISGGAAYPQAACTPGLFQQRQASGEEITAGVCRDGSPLSGIAPNQTCPVPRVASPGGFNCLNSSTNVAPTATPGTDGRIYNLTLRAGSGSIVLDSDGKQVTGAFYRIHTTTPAAKAGDAEPCRRDTSTVQIGCLVQANPCSIGFAGLEAMNVSGATNLKVNNNRPTAKNIRELLKPVPGTNLYPLARKLWLNTMIGFENVVDKPTGEEDTLLSCYTNRTIVDAAVNKVGFTTLDDTGTLPIQCQDFNDLLCAGQVANVDACANN
jgi:ABC-type phosphate transport system substrate-binding protein